jgi:hypothetical protein
MFVGALTFWNQNHFFTIFYGGIIKILILLSMYIFPPAVQWLA